MTFRLKVVQTKKKHASGIFLLSGNHPRYFAFTCMEISLELYEVFRNACLACSVTALCVLIDRQKYATFIQLDAAGQ